MFERTVLAVDPGTRALGLAVVGGDRAAREPVVIWAETFGTPATMPAAERLRRLAGCVRDAIAAHAPDAMAIERLLWNRNVGSAMEVARASGAIMAAAAEAGLCVEEYAPLEVKMAITGSGSASKEQVRRGLSLLLGPANVPTQPDAADAVAIAVCHLQQSRLRGLTRGAGAR
jgi:crossover junction endodeoxyribonuclease RuvC